ncbi:hypothetical protein [Sphingomonas limnosediminicola]
MPRILPIIIVVIAIIGGLIVLSTRVKEQPTHTIEVAVPAGNAH